LHKEKFVSDMVELLSIKDLHVHFSKGDGRIVHALNGISLRVRAGEAVGILGESGSGKSTLVKTLLRLLPRTARVTGDIEFAGRKILQLSERELNQIRGARIALIPQEPGLALNPVLKIGDQVAEVLRVHKGWSWKRCRTEAESALDQVGLRSSSRRFYDAYPHQLSGGQQQRAVIAQALACQPALIIADEPTAALDSETEAQILDLFRDLKAGHNPSLLFITHNPELLRHFADRVAVLYAGRVVETKSTETMFENARHPYAKGLLACAPTQGTRLAPSQRLHTIAGMPPDPEKPGRGCSFAPRCDERLEQCEARHPQAQEMNDEESVECFLYGR
jgi:peptide/nickel transport system ATP-binding protein